MSLAIVLLLAVLLLAGAAFLVVRAGEREQQEDVGLRMRVLGGHDESVAALSLDEAQAVHNPALRWICHLVWRTGVDMQPSTVLRILIGVALFVPLALLVFGALAGLALIVLALVVGWLLLTQKAVRRRAKIVGQLPPFLESTIRVLAAGNTLDEALASAAREAPEPIKPLFISISRRVRLGAPLEAVLMDAGEIHQLRDLKIMALAASINRKFGGSMRNVLRSLIDGIRMRENAARELRALTAETRFSAMVLAIIPIAIMFFMVWRNPAYYAQMWADSSGRMLLAGTIGLQVAGMVIIWRMMKSTEDG